MSSYGGGTLSHSSSGLFTGQPPKVTGLSPKEGPPGTKITIRGENLGKSEDDLIGVSICDVDCLIWAEWKSDKKILARSSIAYGLGDVIVFTKSGGIGTCTVQFRSVKEIISPTKESAVWVNEDEHFTFNVQRHRNSISPVLYNEPDPLGLLHHVGEPTTNKAEIGEEEKKDKNDDDDDDDDDDDVQSSKPKLTETVLRNFFSEAQELSSDIAMEFGNLSSTNFLPAWYLLENYQGFRFRQLKQGLEHLRKVNSSPHFNAPEKGPINLLKPNVLAVIECLDALKAVNLALKKDKQETGTELTHRIEDSIKRATSEAHEIFDTILTRKDTVDSTRNALNVLQRYRFLFNLPSCIEANIQKGDFDAVINDYIRARSLFADTQVKVFQRVYREVETRIEKFKVTLGERLMQCCKQSEARDTDEIRRLIKHLMHLEVSGNPGWDCINTIKDLLREQMNQCRDKHLNMANQRKVKMAEESKSHTGEFESIVENDGSEPQPVQFIEELTTLFLTTFEDLVKLCNYYLNGELYAKESREKHKAKELILNTEMFQRPIDLLSNLMRGAILPETVRNQLEAWTTSNNQIFVRWLPHCLRLTIACYNNLALLELPCTSMLTNLQQFIFDLRVHSLVCVFKQAAEEVKSLSSKETWDLCLDDQIGTRTQLPLLFEAKVEEILRLVRETILQTSLPDEQDIFTKINVQGQMKQLAQNLLSAFVLALEETLNDIHGKSLLHRVKLNDEQCTLAVLCNCSFSSSQIVPRLQESFDKYEYPDMCTVVKMVQARFKELEGRLFNRYVQGKAARVIEVMRAVNKLDECTSMRPPIPNSVSLYIKEAIMALIEVQCDVFTICPPLVRRVMCKVIELTLLEVQQILTEQQQLRNTDEYCNLQAHVDVQALSYVFDNSDCYKNATSSDVLRACRALLRPLSMTGNQRQLVQQLLDHFKQSMQLQLVSFHWNAEQVLIAL